MAYQVIARKWRPQSFEEVTGQEAITRTLRNAIESDRLHHAYLFSGARGVGKTTTARLLAKAVNCHRAERPTPNPCAFTDPEACPSCREVAEGRSIDVQEIDAASNTGVDNVRDAIINTVGVRPARDRYKVFIIDEVHMLSGAAFNALLKTLEEPPPRVLFIMATTESHKLPDTILSRCQQFEFRTIAAAKIGERLRIIAEAEGIKVSDEALREIARAGEGSMRDAQSAFDQVISFSEGEIGTEDVETALGIAGAELRSRVVRAVADARPAEAIAIVDDLVMRGHDLRNFCRDLLAHLRDLLVVKVAGDATVLADASDAERKDLAAEGRNFSESDLVRFFHSLTETEKHLRESAHPRYQLEIGLVKLIEMRRLAPLGQIVERLGALEEALRTGKSPAGNSGSSTPPAPPVSSGSGGPPRSGRAGGGSRASESAPASAAASSEAAGDDGDEASPAAQKGTQSFVPPSQGADNFAASNDAQTLASNNARAAASNDSQVATPADGRPSAAAPTNPSPSNAPTGLKLVPPPAASETTSDVPFPVANYDAPRSFFEVPPAPRPRSAGGKAGEDRAGQPLSFNDVTSASSAGDARPRADEQAEPTDSLGRIKKALEERRKPFLVAALEGVSNIRIEADELCVEYAPEARHLRDALARPDNARVLREVCCEVLGRETGVRITTKAPGEGDGDPLTEQDEERLEQGRLRERAAGHPVVQQVLKTLRGEIVSVQRIGSDAPPQ
ncbi:MAG TPA: DNA polymerase III subunit gamma/tau [Pyrinomonadaceae bacterium]|nr:DNA polymerase III subunit gamma/tau [Pyrinomonadaceae bacterium]